MMDLEEESDDLQSSHQYVKTTTAARMLGLSTTMIQTLVDKQELEGWKTVGGHRRISTRSIQEYQNRSRTSPIVSDRSVQQQVLLASESRQTIDRLKQASQDWAFPVNLTFIDSITEALLALGADRPNLFVVDMAMHRAQQEKTLQALEGFNAKGKPVSMVLVTKHHELRRQIKANNRLIQITPGPLTDIWLHAFLTGALASQRV